jgi:hypothetical protein
MSARFLLIVVIFLGFSPRCFAQTMLELLPQDAVAGIAIGNLDELIKRGDKFLLDTEINVPLRPSQLFDQGAQFLGINKGLDRKRAAAVVLMPPENKDDFRNFQWLETSLVPILPFTDPDTMAGNFGLAKGKLTPKAVQKIDPKFFMKYATRTLNHIYLSGSDKTIRRVQQSKTLAEAFTPAQRKLFDDSDFMMHLGKFLWTWEDADLVGAVAGKMRGGDDPQEKQFAELFADSLKEVQNAVIGARLQDGIDGHLLLTVPKDGKAAKLLAAMRKQPKSSTLHGLPAGNVLFAQASSGNEGQQALLAKALFNFLLEDLLVRDKVVTQVDRIKYLGIFHEVWSRLQGHRVAVYQNVNESKEGLFSAIAIFDSDDPAGFLREMKTLAKMATADSLDWSRKDVKEEINIPRLVKDLASPAYRVRQAADIKLILVGEPALPYLQKAIDSKELDLETLRRCQKLRDNIGDGAAERRKELLREQSFQIFFRPKLTFVTNVEKRQGQKIDGVQIKIFGYEKTVAHQTAEYKQLFGPDWDKVRLAVIGKQIVVLFGSNVELFDATLRNVQKGDAGLADTKRLAGFFERCARERTFEFHVSVEGILRLTTPKGRLDKEMQLTSVALSLGEASLQLDARVPTAEMRAIAKKAQGVGP